MKPHIAALTLALADQALSLSLPFNADAQLISTSGEHEFVPPNFEAGDQRGPCPGLNALANHNYLPHNGVATIGQFIIATVKIFGLGPIIATVLSVYGALLDGDSRQFSIGADTDKVKLIFSTSGGLSGSHNNYEGDSSPFRGDRYTTGNVDKLHVDKFEQFLDRSPDNNYTFDIITQFRVDRRDHSVQTNPYFFWGPFSGLLVNPGAFAFMPRLMANHSAEHPEGHLTREVLLQFFAVKQTDNGTYNYTEGHERIPDNWYRRPLGFEYGQVPFLLDILAMAAKHPEFLSVGGNTGEVDSFAGADLTDLTGGVLNFQDLAKGDNFACFVFQLLKMTPKFTEQTVAAILDIINGGLGALPNSTLGIDCSQLPGFDSKMARSYFRGFPGSEGVGLKPRKQ
ncbi:unnamed protein product [Bemisia tabaci]|uniref:Heme haloperoxidase family profile domain-containing protein n=1 Tax=Bemisia tabaci TaxID=7038 RepID=A0A9P0FAE6_BEMTA|nr:unnamed protein product [Bemisia tabaci]